jgi:hypothetical protein
MNSIVESNVLFFKSIRILLLSIIIFMLSAGNTFSIVAHHVRVNMDKNAAAKKHESEEESMPENTESAAMLAQAGPSRSTSQSGGFDSGSS